ncbi:MAG: MarR family winged helix-turn-helix transcriptional regulator [Oscillospiraceae bacterium]|nr:MarR family winged helix-turn-helix transcriptional regulator [Oscillospiraceae bacterium]
MVDYKFEGNFLYYVRLLRRMYERTLAEAAAACGLTIPEADVLSFLQENPEFDTARDVALYREVSRAYVSKAVEALAGRGYIEIRQDRDDRRLQHLSISEKAKEAAEILRDAQYAFYGKVTAGLSTEELFGMLSAIEKCAGNLAAEDERQ